MVSAGDTDISLGGILGGQNSKHSKCQDLLNLNFGEWGGGYSGVVKAQSAKSWPNCHLRGGGRGGGGGTVF